MKTVKKGILTLFVVSAGLISNMVKVRDFAKMEASVLKHNDTLYVLNFWATWCKPCVSELPYFLESAKKNSGNKVKFVFASLNFSDELELVQKFVDKRNITQDVFVLKAGDPNKWLDKIDQSWDGSIPATVMYKGGQKVFFKEGEFTQTELDSIINLKNK